MCAEYSHTVNMAFPHFLLLLLCCMLVCQGYARPSRARKAAPAQQTEEDDLRAQMSKLWQEVNSLKEMQALQTVCLRGIKANRKCYLAIEEPKHYHEANEDCIAQGGTLATPRGLKENNDLRDYARDSSPASKDFWIGVTDIVKEGRYVDVNSIAVAYFNWDRARKEPTGGKRESCVVMSLSAQGKWYDEVCRTPKKYICEYLIP